MTSEQKSEGKYRSRDDIGLEMLERLLSGPKSKSFFYFESRFSYSQINEREAWLAEYGLIKVTDATFTITTKGRAYLKARQHAEEIRKGAVA